MVKVKFCGLKNIEEAKFASKLGVFALGFVFARNSSRKVSEATAGDIIGGLYPFVSKGGVFAGQSPWEIKQVVRYCGLDFIQLHGGESGDFIRQLFEEFKDISGLNLNFNIKIIKAFGIKGEESIEKIKEFSGEDLCDAYLFDTYSENSAGGTGRSFNWNYFNTIKNELDKPIILAGGLNPANIYEALDKTGAYGVDVSSGIETDGCKHGKDKTRMKQFMSSVWRWQSQNVKA